MPRYDYQCETCSQVFEVWASVKEKEAGLKPICPFCEGQNTRQIITAGLVLCPGRDAVVQSGCCGPNSNSGCCG
jgi:putative FmdB family regulatory protein